MFYTKYRPQKFSEIQTPNEVVDALVNEIKTQKTVHAYLFIGPRGTGKTTTARILAKALNCTALEKNGDPCGNCPNCVAIQQGKFTDLIEIDAASNRGIEDIRELKDRIKLAPSMGKIKVYIVDEVHMLSMDAFNAFLKTLEEPPKNTVFILCTTEVHKVPETIKSRCQVFRFKRATLAQLKSKLSYIVTAEKAKIPDFHIEKIALASLGGFRDAETLLQQVLEGAVDVTTFLNASPYETYYDFVSSLLAKDAPTALASLNTVFENGSEMYVWTGDLLTYLRNLLIIKSGVSEEVFDLPPELLGKIKTQVLACDLPWLLRAITYFLEAHKNIRSSFIPQLPVELAIVKLCSLDAGKSMPNTSPLPTTPLASRTETPPKIAPPKVAPTDKTTPTNVETFIDFLSEVQNEVKIEPELEIPAVVEVVEVQLAEIEFCQVEAKWTELVQKVSKINNSISALLKNGKPRGIEGKVIILEVGFAFHKERLESAKNRVIVEQSLRDVFEKPLGIRCDLVKNANANLTDFNITVPAGVESAHDSGKLMEVFDGGLPLNLH